MSRRRRRSFSRRALVTMALIDDDDAPAQPRGVPAPGIPVPKPRPSEGGNAWPALLVVLAMALLALRARRS